VIDEEREDAPAGGADGAAPSGAAPPPDAVAAGAAGADAPPPGPAGAAAPAADAEVPSWVGIAVVAGAVLFLQGFLIRTIGQAAGGEGPGVVGDLALVAWLLGALALGAGYFAFLNARAGLAGAFEAMAASCAAVLLYLLSWRILGALVSDGSADLFFVKPTGLAGRGAAGVALAGLLAAVAGFGFAFRWAAKLGWPYFRAGVALNVLAMFHLVVLLLGVASALNLRFTPRFLGTGIDLTSSRDFSLGERTRETLRKVDGELSVFLVDYSGQRGAGSGTTRRVRDLLAAYAAACPRMTYRELDVFRQGEDARTALREAGIDDLPENATGDDDMVAMAYRLPGERMASRVKWVKVDQEFTDVSVLGNERFRGEGILTNAVHELVFAQRKAYFTAGHGERAISGAETGPRGLREAAEALRRDNFSVQVLDMTHTPSVPADADLVVVAEPRAPFQPAEVEALKRHLEKGGALVVMLDVPWQPQEIERATGLEPLLRAWGLEAKRDHAVVSYIVERTAVAGDLARAVLTVAAGSDEMGRHPLVGALQRTGFKLVFHQAVPVFVADDAPKEVEAKEVLFAPRSVGEQALKPFAMKLTVPRRGQGLEAQAEDLQDRRLPLAVAAERKEGGGRLVLFGDADFASDQWLLQSPANGTLVLNAASWAVRRDLIVIDPRTIEAENVSLRTLDRELAFWSTVVALPLLTLGAALGVWWSRRR
jgi:hypothetical protein